MPRNLTKNFFKQKGISLSAKNAELAAAPAFPRESIATLSNVNPTREEIIFDNFQAFKKSIKDRANFKFLRSQAHWGVALMTFTAMFSLFVFRVPVYKQAQVTPQKYTLFSAKPLTMEASNQDLDFSDSRAVKIDSAFKFFNCPLYGLGKKFVEQADENDIPYWVVAAIAFQESSCGKNTPTKDGVRTSNAWGWATYGDQVYDFDSFEHGIEVVSRYMSKRFYSQGVTDLCAIMKTYTPPSNGSWCRGVGYFGDFIRSYKTPQV